MRRFQSSANVGFLESSLCCGQRAVVDFTFAAKAVLRDALNCDDLPVRR